MDAIDLVRRDHRDMEKLFAEFDQSTSDKDRARLFGRIRAKILSHEAAELSIFYPAIKNAAADEIKKSVKDYVEANKILKELQFNDDRFDERFGELKSLIQDHMESDESAGGVLDIARERLETSELRQMAQQIQSIRQTVRDDKAA